MNLKIILPAILFISAVSCKKAQTNTDIRIDAPITIQLKQSVPAKGKAILSFLCTTGSFPKIDYKLVSNITWAGNKVAVSFTKITPGNSQSTPGPAAAYISLGALTAGSYPLSFKVNTSVYEGALIVSDTDYQLSFPQTHDSIVFVNTALKRLQLNTIWGEATVFNDTDASFANSFIDSMVVYGAGTYMGPVGNYDIFHNDSGFSYNPLTKNFLTKQFIYTYTGSFIDVDKLVTDFDRQYPVKAMIRIYTYTGQDNEKLSVPVAVKVEYSN